MRPGSRIGAALGASLLAFAFIPVSSAQTLADEQQQALQEHLEVMHVIHESHGDEVPYRNLVYASIQGMLRTLDPHTSFLTPESYENMRTRQQGSFFGVGILVSMRNGQLTVIAPIEGTPAWRAGLQTGDVITQVDGEATDTMSLDEAVSKIKGPTDTEVRLTIARRGLDQPLSVPLRRAEIAQETVRYAYLMEPGTGYIRLTDFSRSTAREMAEALDELRREGMERLLLDLRSNGGGLLDAVVAVADHFLPAQSTIVETRGRVANSHQQFLANDERPQLGIPVVVLVNNGTASAAEILAGAIQDHDVGLIVGAPTWGKGLVQTVYNLSYGTGIALTTARYHTPSGRVIQRDYSSYYDYYTHFGQPGDGSPAAPARPELEFRTDLGRKVYGGGGITPDVSVELPPGPQILQVLYVHNAFFDFAVDYHGRQPVASEAWRPSDEILDEFAVWLREEETLDEETVEEFLANEEARAFARRQIHSDIFTTAFGVEAAHRVLAEGDVQIQSALEQLDEAAALLARRRSVLEPERKSATPRARAAPSSPAAIDRRASATEIPIPRLEEWPADLKAAYQLLLGKRLGDDGAFPEAVDALRSSVELAPDDPYTHLELAILHGYLATISRREERQRESLQAAVAAATAAQQRAPGDPDVLRVVGSTHWRQAEMGGESASTSLDAARDAYQTLREKVPGELQALTSLGQIYLWQKKPALAAEVLREAAAYRPGHPMIEEMLLDAMLESEDLDGAERLLEEIVARRPDAMEHREQLADLYADRGEHRRAVEVLRGGPESAMRSTRMRSVLAQELHLSGANEEALALTDGLVEELPEDRRVGLRRLRVAILDGLGRYPEAVGELETVLDGELDSRRTVQSTLHLSRLLERIGRAGEAAARLRDLANRETGSSALRAKLALVGVLQREGSVDEAAALLRDELEGAQPDSVRVLGQALGDLLVRANRPEEALAVADLTLERLRREDTSVLEPVRLWKLKVLAQGEDWEQVAALAPSLLEAGEPEVRAAAHSLQGEALAALGRVEEAVERLTEAERALGSPRLFAKRVEILFANHRSAEARALLEHRVASGKAEDLFLAASLHQRGERYDESIPILERYLAEDPSSLQALFLLGAGYERSGENEKAAATFERLLELAPEHPPTLNYLGYMWAEQGENLEAALSMIRRAVALDPDNGAYVDSLGFVFLELGRPGEARLHLEWAVRLIPDDPTIREHLGDLYVLLEDRDRAREAYQRALDLGGDDGLEEVRRKLLALEE